MHPGRAVDGAARRKRRQTYPELERACRCRLVVVGVEVGGRFGAEAANWLRLLAKHRAADVSPELHEVLADVRSQLLMPASRHGLR